MSASGGGVRRPGGYRGTGAEGINERAQKDAVEVRASGKADWIKGRGAIASQRNGSLDAGVRVVTSRWRQAGCQVQEETIWGGDWIKGKQADAAKKSGKRSGLTDTETRASGES